jgi:hypothetical protein
MIFPILGWAAVVALAAATVHGVRHGIRQRDYFGFAIAGLYACAAVIILAVLGVIHPVAAGVYAALACGVTAGISVKVSGRGAPATLAGFAGSAIGFLGADIRNLFRRLRPGLVSVSGGEEAGPHVAAVAEAVATRAIPSLREDTALGVPPEPAAIASAAPVPAVYAALADYIASFEAEDDQALRMFMESNAAGGVALAEAWHAFGEHCLNGAGLHPAYVAGILEVGDGEAENAAHKVQAHRRFHVIYGSVKEWIAAHGPLPHRAREFLTGEDAA